jgi:hypothetical protein
MTTPSGVLNSSGRRQKKERQAGAELCQAQFKLGLPKVLHFIENWKTIEVVFDLK